MKHKVDDAELAQHIVNVWSLAGYTKLNLRAAKVAIFIVRKHLSQ